MKHRYYYCTLPLLAALLLVGCKPSERETVANDSNTPLHLLQPAYRIPYGATETEEVKKTIDRVLHFLEEATPARVVNTATGEEITDYSLIDNNAALAVGTFRLTSYEWGVTYSAMLAAAAATGDDAYFRYAAERMRLLAETAPYFSKATQVDPQMKRLLYPAALDDAGAICAAMIKAMTADETLPLTTVVENYIDYILNKEYRLADGTFARCRPHYNTLWLDDMFMGIPPVAYYAKIAPDPTPYYDEAVKQIRQFASRMWVPEKRLFRHGWVEGMAEHPAFHWGRANGWALLTMAEVLDILPEEHPGREEVLTLFKEHVGGLAALQSGEGFWHQLLDRNDSYLETSATAIYAYCIAHGINEGWLDAMVYGPVAQLAWNAVSTMVTEEGHVEGVCVGTGMAFDPTFYYYRPVNPYAAHGYGPVIWAGAEMIRLLNAEHPKMNDSAVQFYRTAQQAEEPIFSVTEQNQ